MAATLTADEGRMRTTFRLDRVRGACAGMLETGAFTFGLVVAIRYFDASPLFKATVSSAHALGLLLTPVSLYVFTRAGWNAARSAATILLLGAILTTAAAFAPSLGMFVLTFVPAVMFIAQQSPFLVHIYTTNYPASRRGRLLSNSIVFSLATGVIFSIVGGHLLDARIDAFRGLFVVTAIAAVIAAWAVARMPAEPFAVDRRANPLAGLRCVREDRVFGAMLAVWMLMGIGNLIMIPLRIEYLANPRFGIDASNTEIAIIVAVIPSIVRLASTHLWGIFFDCYNFFIIRTAVSGFSLTAILVFFGTDNLVVIGVGAALFGVSFAGGNIAWNLWVTKFAPPDRTSEYMSVHTFLTGVRGLGAPFLGFYLIARIEPLATAAVGAGLIALSMILLDPLRRHHARLATDAGVKPVRRQGT